MSTTQIRPQSLAQSIQKANGTDVPQQLDQYAITIKELDQNGLATVYTVPAPSSPDFGSWTLMQQVAMLKKGAWSKQPIPEIIFGIAYSRSLGLDITQGDVFPTGAGRIGTSNKAKIKMALASGNIEGIETEIKELSGAAPQGCTGAKHDLECIAIIHVKGWKVPIINKGKLSAWFKAANPNWVGNPEHMLKLNTIAHACELVHPTATEEDERPPEVATEIVQGPISRALSSAANTQNKENIE